MPDDAENGRVSFTTKELLSRIEGKLDMLAVQVQGKADLSETQAARVRIEQLERDMQEGKETVKSLLLPQFNDMVSRVKDLERNVDKLESLETVASSISMYKRWLAVVAIPAVLGAVWAIIKIVVALQHGGISP